MYYNGVLMVIALLGVVLELPPKKKKKWTFFFKKKTRKQQPKNAAVKRNDAYIIIIITILRLWDGADLRTRTPNTSPSTVVIIIIYSSPRSVCPSYVFIIIIFFILFRYITAARVRGYIINKPDIGTSLYMIILLYYHNMLRRGVSFGGRHRRVRDGNCVLNIYYYFLLLYTFA